ncbi:hypothetical protein [Haladaptatus sp. DFWS20]|uniref:hypothetical protein n=1 Tax=Haladaptatus sp. DFWS20 TaxID=3403467 RepID=UPI003EBD1214
MRKLSHDPFDNVPTKAVTVDGEDDIKGCLVHGGTNGGADVYAVTGELTYGNLSGMGKKNGTGKVYVDGSDATTTFERGIPPSSGTNTDCDEPTTTTKQTTTPPEPESKVICDARSADSQVEITIQVTEKVYYQGVAHDGVTFIIDAGESAAVPFSGELICFTVTGGDCDVTMQYRN